MDAFELWTWRRILRTPWTERRTNLSILEEVKPKRSLDATICQLNLRYFGHVMRTEGTRTGYNAGKSSGTQETRKTAVALD
jgi:hypothetical protein